jgi:hypothetical protein
MSLYKRAVLSQVPLGNFRGHKWFREIRGSGGISYVAGEDMLAIMYTSGGVRSHDVIFVREGSSWRQSVLVYSADGILCRFGATVGWSPYDRLGFPVADLYTEN